MRLADGLGRVATDEGEVAQADASSGRVGDDRKRLVGARRGGDVAQFERRVAERGEGSGIVWGGRQDRPGVIARRRELVEGDEDHAAVVEGDRVVRVRLEGAVHGHGCGDVGADVPGRSRQFDLGRGESGGADEVARVGLKAIAPERRCRRGSGPGPSR